MLRLVQEKMTKVIITSFLITTVALIPQAALALTPEEATKAVEARSKQLKDAENLVLELAYRNASKEELKKAALRKMELQKEMSAAIERVGEVFQSVTD